MGLNKNYILLSPILFKYGLSPKYSNILFSPKLLKKYIFVSGYSISVLHGTKKISCRTLPSPK